MLRGCVVGLGAMGSNHVRVLHELREERKIELVGVADIKEDLAREIARRYGVDWFPYDGDASFLEVLRVAIH